MRYNIKVRSGKKSPKYHIDLVDADLNKKYKYIYTLKSEIGYDVSAATQIAENQVLLLVKKDLGYDSKIDYKNLFYVIDYTENSCKRVKSPFPKMLYVDNYITADDGRSYYVSGQTKDDRSGLFFYDCSQNTVEPILLDDWEREDHIVNFNLVKQ